MIKLKSILLEQAINSKLANVIKGFENNKAYKPGGWDPIKKRWYPHPSPEGGLKTIGFGHKCKTAQEQAEFERTGLTDSEANILLQNDLKTAEAKAKRLVQTYDTVPVATQQALINACYRGELGTEKTPTTLKLMNSGKWLDAAKEYLNHAEYQAASADSTVRRRMDWNAARFSDVTKVKEPTKSDKSDNVDLIGKMLYPRKTSTRNYATVRTSPEVNTGLIHNEQVKIVWPDPVGIVAGTRMVGRDTWYQIKLPKDIGNGTGLGWVRFDVVTTDKNAKFQ